MGVASGGGIVPPVVESRRSRGGPVRPDGRAAPTPEPGYCVATYFVDKTGGRNASCFVEQGQGRIEGAASGQDLRGCARRPHHDGGGPAVRRHRRLRQRDPGGERRRE